MKSAKPERSYVLEDNMLIFQKKTMRKMRIRGNGLVEMIGRELHDLGKIWMGCKKKKKRVEDKEEVNRRALRKFEEEKLQQKEMKVDKR